MFFRLCRPKKSVVNNQFCTCNTREPTDNKLTGVAVSQQNFLYKSRWQVYLACSHSLTGFPAGISGKEPACSAGDLKDRVQYPGGENGNPLQYSCLENPVDRGALWAAVHRITQSWTRLKRLSMHTCIGEGNGNSFHYTCLENPRDRGAW